MEFVPRLRRNAAALGKTIVLPEAADERMLRAAALIRDERIARIVLLGEPARITAQCTELGIDPSGLDLIDHTADAEFDAYVAAYHAKREAKGMTAELARETRSRPAEPVDEPATTATEDAPAAAPTTQLEEPAPPTAPAPAPVRSSNGAGSEARCAPSTPRADGSPPTAQR